MKFFYLRANKNLGVYKGALYENIVGEALVSVICTENKQGGGIWENRI